MAGSMRLSLSLQLHSVAREVLTTRVDSALNLWIFIVDGSLCFEELVLMMRSCVIGLLKFMGEREIPDDEEFEGLAELALNSAKESSHLDPNETPALSFPQFTEWANGTGEVLNALEKMSSRALVNARRDESSDESAPEASSEDDSDLEEEHMGIHERGTSYTP